MSNKIELIKKFIAKILAQYPELYIDFDYDSELDEYDIWHNNPDLEFKDKNFKKFVGQIAQELFFDNNIYNFSFGYDYYKAKKLEDSIKKYTVNNTKIDNIEFNFFDIGELLNYSNDINKKTNSMFWQNSIEIKLNNIELTSSKSYSLNTSPYTSYNNAFNIKALRRLHDGQG